MKINKPCRGGSDAADVRLQHRLTKELFRTAGFTHTYRRLILPFANTEPEVSLTV